MKKQFFARRKKETLAISLRTSIETDLQGVIQKLSKYQNIKGKSPKSIKKLKVFEVFPEIVLQLKKDSRLSLEDIEQLESIFGDRVKKALELVGEKKIHKYTFIPSGVIRWVVTGGKEKDYLVIEHTYCSCKDFLFNALYRRDVPSCYHLLAREISERTEKYEEVKVKDELYSSLMSEWLS